MSAGKFSPENWKLVKMEPNPRGLNDRGSYTLTTRPRMSLFYYHTNALSVCVEFRAEDDIHVQRRVSATKGLTMYLDYFQLGLSVLLRL